MSPATRTRTYRGAIAIGAGIHARSGVRLRVDACGRGDWHTPQMPTPRARSASSCLRRRAARPTSSRASSRSRLSEQMKQQVIVDNRAGASGIIGRGDREARGARRLHARPRHRDDFRFAARAQTGAAVRRRPRFRRADAHRVGRERDDRQRGARRGERRATWSSSRRRGPGQLNYGSAGNGSPAHLAGAMLNVLAGIDTVHVPYKGAAPAMTDLIGGQLQILITSPLVAMPHGRAGRIRVLATTGAKRDPLLPELPVVADTVPGYDIVQWWGVALPIATPQSIATTRAHAEVVAALATSAKRAMRMRKNGATPQPESPAEFVAFMKLERERIARVGRQAKIVIDLTDDPHRAALHRRARARAPFRPRGREVLRQPADALGRGEEARGRARRRAVRARRQRSDGDAGRHAHRRAGAARARRSGHDQESRRSRARTSSRRRCASARSTRSAPTSCRSSSRSCTSARRACRCSSRRTTRCASPSC